MVRTVFRRAHPTRSVPASSLARAFSLIEVLLAVFILALGLLGLGAMVPVVIREQREASDTTLGLAVAHSAQSYLRNRPDLNRLSDSKSAPIGWGVWYQRETGGAGWSTDYSWEPSPAGFKDKSGADADDEPKVGFNVSTGRMRLQYEVNSTGTPTFICVRDRLWPDAGVGGVQPRFVWDIVGRRVQAATGRPRQIQIALFVRRIDPNIRVPVGATLFQVLTQFDYGAGRLVPVGVEPNGNKQPGKRRPTLDGTGDYAKPFRVNVLYDQNFPGRIRLSDADAQTLLTWQLFSRTGQKLADNLGNVYTVIALDPTDINSVRVDPPVEPSVGSTEDPGLQPDQKADATVWAKYYRQCDTLRNVILTPQIPAAVAVFNVDVENLDRSPSGSGSGSVSP